MLGKRLASWLGLVALVGMTGCCQWCQRHCCQPVGCYQPAASPCGAPPAPTCCPAPSYAPAPPVPVYQGYPATQLQRPVPSTGFYNYDCCQ